MNAFSFLLTTLLISSMFGGQTTCKRSGLTSGKNNANAARKSTETPKKGQKQVEPDVRPEETGPLSKVSDLSPEEIARLTLPAVVLVLVDNGGEIAQGSGFFVGPGIVITNYHVVQRASTGSVQIDFWTKTEVRHAGVARIVAFDEESDLAVLDIPAARARNVSILSLSKEKEAIDIGETVYAVGNPEGLLRTFSTGMVSGRIRSDNNSARIQITAPISHGSSGGPIVNTKGEVIGVAVGSVSEGQNLNFAVPADLVYSIIRTSNLTM